MKNVLLAGLALAVAAMAVIAWSYRQEAASQRLAADLSRIVRHPEMPETPSRTIVARKQYTNAEYYRPGTIDERW